MEHCLFQKWDDYCYALLFNNFCVLEKIISVWSVVLVIFCNFMNAQIQVSF